MASILAACTPGKPWHAVDVAGHLPPLAFSLTRADDGRAVSARDYRGEVVLVYFGYTNCPDACPMTLMDLTGILKRLGKQAEKVRILFVTVDPGRDSLAVLKGYAARVSPLMVGLRGGDDATAAMARRYRVAYSAAVAPDGRPYEVSHSSAVYVFDASGAARLLLTGPELAHDGDGVAADLRRILSEKLRI